MLCLIKVKLNWLSEKRVGNLNFMEYTHTLLYFYQHFISHFLHYFQEIIQPCEQTFDSQTTCECPCYTEKACLNDIFKSNAEKWVTWIFYWTVNPCTNLEVYGSEVAQWYSQRNSVLEVAGSIPALVIVELLWLKISQNLG